jgi:O-antigen ligase
MVFLTVFVIYKRKYLWKKWVTLLISLSLLAALINATENGQFLNRVNSAISDTYKVASKQSTGREGSSRFFIWEKSMPLIPEYFWIGSGPDTFEFIFRASPAEMKEFLGSPNTKVDKAHNEYLQIAITIGTPALVTYLVFVFLILRKAYQGVKRAEGKEKIIIYGLIATIIGYLVQAFFNISTVPVAPLYWAIMGLTLAKSTSILNDKSMQNRSMELPYKSA